MSFINQTRAKMRSVQEIQNILTDIEIYFLKESKPLKNASSKRLIHKPIVNHNVMSNADVKFRLNKYNLFINSLMSEGFISKKYPIKK